MSVKGVEVEPDGLEHEPVIVLNVDDDVERKTLKPRHLKALGATAQAVATPGKAKVWLKEYFSVPQPQPQPLIVLLDLMFPDSPGPGLDLIKWIRSGENEWIPQDLPIVVYSAADEEEVMTTAYSLGANSFVVKGNDPKVLVRTLETYTGREVRDSRVECEVIDLDVVRGLVKIRFRGNDDCEPSRVFRRANSLRGLAHGKTEEVLT